MHSEIYLLGACFMLIMQISVLNAWLTSWNLRCENNRIGIVAPSRGTSLRLSAPASALRDCPEWRLTLLGLAVARTRGGKRADPYYRAAVRGARDKGRQSR